MKERSDIKQLMRFAFGLGNPGEDYRLTRHNLGYMVIDRFVMDGGGKFKAGKGKYLFGEISYGTTDLILLKPLTFMNLSGIPVSEAKEFFGADLKSFLVVVDDVNLPFGKLRLRESGSAGGHKGLASIIFHLSTEDFARLRIGVGKPDDNELLSEYVLLKFSAEEMKKLPGIIDDAIESIRTWCDEGIEKAMSITNKEAV